MKADKKNLPLVYVLPITQAAIIPEAWCEKNFPKRLERSRKFRREEDRLRSIAAGVLEYYALGVDESRIVIDENGKPAIPGSGYYFSVSHSGNYAILALSECEAGTDIEKIENGNPRVAERVFTPEELSWMNEDAKMRFYILWTLKESVCKLDGRGLSLPPESFSVLPMIKGESITINGKKLFGCSRIFDDCVVSFCSTAKTALFPLKLLTAGDILDG